MAWSLDRDDLVQQCRLNTKSSLARHGVTPARDFFQNRVPDHSSWSHRPERSRNGPVLITGLVVSLHRILVGLSYDDPYINPLIPVVPVDPIVLVSVGRVGRRRGDTVYTYPPGHDGSEG